MIGVGIDGLAVGLVVEADVAAGDRNVERAAGLGDPLDRFDELPHDLGPLRVAEVQAVRGADRHARRRTRRCARPRPPPASRRAADRGSSSARFHRSTSPARGRALDAHDAGAHARRARACWSAPCGRTGGRPSACSRSSATPAAAGTLSAAGVAATASSSAAARRRYTRAARSDGRRPAPRRRARVLGISATTLPPILDAQQAVVGDVADVRRVQIPLLEDALDLGLAALLDDEQHALLRFGEHDLVGRHAGLALRHVLDVDLDAAAAARAHLGRRTGQPGRAHVLHADRARRSSSARGRPRAAASP